MLILLACVTVNALAVREAVRFTRDARTDAARKVQHDLAVTAAADRRARIAAATPSVRPAGIIR